MGKREEIRILDETIEILLASIKGALDGFETASSVTRKKWWINLIGFLAKTLRSTYEDRCQRSGGL